MTGTPRDNQERDSVYQGMLADLREQNLRYLEDHREMNQVPPIMPEVRHLSFAEFHAETVRQRDLWRVSQ